jgi:hypothetical protein
VAWDLEIRQTPEGLENAVARLVNLRIRTTGRRVDAILQDADVLALRNQRSVRRLRYVGKPNRYRAMEAQRFLRRGEHEQLIFLMEAEFDREGIIYSRLGGEVYKAHAHTAYHPHSGTLGPIEGFGQKFYTKRIGGQTIYSYKNKLSQDEVELYYQWWEKAFKKKLRRPKGKASAMKEPVEGAPVEAQTPIPLDIRDRDMHDLDFLDF